MIIQKKTEILKDSVDRMVENRLSKKIMNYSPIGRWHKNKN